MYLLVADKQLMTYVWNTGNDNSGFINLADSPNKETDTCIPPPNKSEESQGGKKAWYS